MTMQFFCRQTGDGGYPTYVEVLLSTILLYRSMSLFIGHYLVTRWHACNIWEANSKPNIYIFYIIYDTNCTYLSISLQPYGIFIFYFLFFIFYMNICM